MTMNKNDRMNTLSNNGFDTSKFFNVLVSKDVPKGTTFTITVGDNGNLDVKLDEQVNKILNNIEDEGYVKSSNLFRRWVMAQTFRMLNHPLGWKAALDEKPYNYQWTMLENEFHALSKLEKEDKDTFEKRKCFFTAEVFVRMLEDYRAKLKEESTHYWGSYANYKVSTGDTIAKITIDAVLKANNYDVLYKIVKEFNKECKNGRPDIRLNNKTEKCKAWIEAFKGAGAYYTLDNLMRYHFSSRFYIPTETGRTLAYRSFALKALEQKKKECYHSGQWYKLFGYMKEIIAINEFDFGKAMNKVYNR